MLILTEYDVTIDGHQVLCCRRKVNFQSKSTSLIHMTPSLTFVWLGVALGHKPWWTPPRIYDRCFHSDINLIYFWKCPFKLPMHRPVLGSQTHTGSIGLFWIYGLLKYVIISACIQLLYNNACRLGSFIDIPISAV